MRYPSHLLKLIQVLKKLPGVGNRSAERFAFQLLSWKPEHLIEMADVFKEIPVKLSHCSRCGCLIGEESCAFCSEARAQTKKICVIATARDAFCIEETREFKGLYHVLGCLLSPLSGVGPEKLQLDKLKQRIAENGIEEMIIALDSTLEGDATSLFIKREFADHAVKISRLAFGLPMGSSFDYIDGGTLTKAILGRAQF